MQDSGGNCKRNAIHIIGTSEEGESGVDIIMPKNVIIFMADRKPQIQEPQRTSSRINTK